jgi:hypothetical protein
MSNVAEAVALDLASLRTEPPPDFSWMGRPARVLLVFDNGVVLESRFIQSVEMVWYHLGETTLRTRTSFVVDFAITDHTTPVNPVSGLPVNLPQPTRFEGPVSPERSRNIR